MQISLDVEQVALLAAVAHGRVHMDPRYRAPDFERDLTRSHVMHRATKRLAPLKRWELVELVDEDQADQYGVRLYRLTELGGRLLGEARAQQATADAEADTWGSS